MSVTEVVLEPVSCPRCPAQVAPSLLTCPGCGALMRSDDLKLLAAKAAEAASAGDLRAEIATWRTALELLPPGSDQARIITGKVQELGKRIQTSGGTPPPPPPALSAREAAVGMTGSSHKNGSSHHTGTKAGIGAAVVAVGLILLKSKGLVIFLLTKAKFLALGLTKFSTFGSMLLSMSVYWTLWGWKFAVGLVVSIYIHEMGHVFELRKYGFRASAPAFIPGLGALIRLHQHPVSGREDARVGLAGPMWGLGAALAAYGIYFLTAEPYWAAIARVGAWINLFNLLPVFSLDGARGFRALNKMQRLIVAAGFATAWTVTQDGMLLILAVVAGGVAVMSEPSDEADIPTLIQFLGLIAVLSAMLMIPLDLKALGLR